MHEGKLRAKLFLLDQDVDYLFTSTTEWGTQKVIGYRYTSTLQLVEYAIEVSAKAVLRIEAIPYIEGIPICTAIRNVSETSIINTSNLFLDTENVTLLQ